MTTDRRTFLATSLASALVSERRLLSGHAMALSVEPNMLSKADLPTPALLLDLTAFESNLKTLADYCAKSGCGFRPHAKTHKCPEIARRQVASGAIGISVATVPEAEAMVEAGISGVLLTSPIVEPGKIQRMIALAKRGDVMLSIGHRHQADLLAAAAEAAQTRIRVLVDLDVGDRRTGIMPGQPAVELAKHMAQSRSLDVRGVQAYAGHASHAIGFEHRVEVSQRAMALAVATREQMVKAGLQATILSGGSTGTYNIDSHISGVTELQVGSYVFMDVNYRAIGSKGGDPVYCDFQPSLTVLTSVVSTTHADRVSVDAGTKSFSTDVSEKPEAKDRRGIVYSRFGDEFGSLTAESGGTLPSIGDRLEFFVPHCDPTVNLYDRLYAMRGDTVEAIWPIRARKEPKPI